MPIDSSLVGNVINALPLDRMISGPLNAMVTAQVQASKSYVEFLEKVCLDEKSKQAKTVTFSYQENLLDSSGKPIADKPPVTREMKVPLLAIVSHPNITIEEGTVDFELNISQSLEETSSNSTEVTAEASIGWSIFSASMKGSVSHKSEQTRKTDTRAKYSIHTRIARQDAPEALQRIIDVMTNSSDKPAITTKGSGGGDQGGGGQGGDQGGGGQGGDA